MFIHSRTESQVQGRRLLARGLSWILLALMIASLVWLPALAGPGGGLPPAGTDDFDSSVQFTVELFGVVGSPFDITASGPTIIERSDPAPLPSGHSQIQTEIVSMHLTSITPAGPLTVRESHLRDSLGTITELAPGTGFPADSFFDVYVEIEFLGTTISNLDPVRVQAEIDAIPPFQEEYTPPNVIGVPLYDSTGRQVGLLTHAAHWVGEKPSFSVAPGGTSGLDPATIFDVPTAPRFLSSALGLQAGDDVDGIAFGVDYIRYNSDVRFSVDPLASGSPGSAVAAEAAKMPAEAHGDEFAVSPHLPFGGSNVQIMDETGDTAPPFPLLLPLDDLDALTEHPTTLSDLDKDGAPDMALYFSLSAGSPSLGTLSASPADILFSSFGLPPIILYTQANLGLVPGDDVDAFCLDITNPSSPTILFSLAPGSPTIALTSGSPATLYGGATIPLSSPPPIFAPAVLLGLEDTDNLNALKCTWPEVDYFGRTKAEIEISAGPITETVILWGWATVQAAIGSDGATQNFAGPDQVQTELVSMSLTGESTRLLPGPVKLSISAEDLAHSPPIFLSEGFITELMDDNPGVLDVAPFGSGGSGDSFFDVFFEIEVSGQVLHTHSAKHMQTIISHKPPAEGETYVGVNPVQLFDQLHNPQPITITRATHTIPYIANFDLPAVAGTAVFSDGVQLHTVPLLGRMTLPAFVNEDGQGAQDQDLNGLDEASAELDMLFMTGMTETLEVTITRRTETLSPFFRSGCTVEENANLSPGVLDVPPFVGTNVAAHSEADGNTSFSCHWYVEQLFTFGSPRSGDQASGASMLHNGKPMTITGTLSEFPLGAGDILQSQNAVPLLDESDMPSGWTLVSLNLQLAPIENVYLPAILKVSSIPFAAPAKTAGSRIAIEQAAVAGPPGAAPTSARSSGLLLILATTLVTGAGLARNTRRKDR